MTLTVLTERENDYVGRAGTRSAGAAYATHGRLCFGTAPLADSFTRAPGSRRSCCIGCFLDLDATPARMTVFVDGKPLAVQCEYDFPKDGRAWFPSVALWQPETALHSCAI